MKRIAEEYLDNRVTHLMKRFNVDYCHAAHVALAIMRTDFQEFVKEAIEEIKIVGMIQGAENKADV